MFPALRPGVLVLTCLGLTMRCGAEEAPVTIGPGVFTFPEIAARLSATGRKVECAPEIRGFAAVVNLKGRGWDDARKALASGLDVRFTPVPGAEGEWLMERDPDVAARERDLRARLIRELTVELLRVVAEAGGTDEAYAKAYSTFEELQAQFEQLRKEAAAGGQPDPRARALGNAATNAMVQSGPARWLGYRILRRGLPPDLPNVVKADLPLRPVDTKDLADDESWASLWAVLAGGGRAPYALAVLRSAHPLPEHVDCYLGFSFEPMSFVLRANVALVGDGAVTWPDGPFASIGPMASENYFKGAPPGNFSGSRYAGLGKEAVDRFEAERGGTVAFLESEAGKAIFTCRGPGPSHSLSTLMEDWIAGTGREAVMELYPGRESLGMVLGVHVLAPEPGSRYTLNDVLSPAIIWSLRAQDGVLLVKDRLAFVDRFRPLPICEYLSLERRLRPHGSEMPHVSDAPLDALVTLAGSLPPGQKFDWMSIPAGVYRGVDIGMLSIGLPYLRFIHRLPHCDRTRLRTALLHGGTWEISLADAPAASIEELAAGFPAEESDPFFLRPDLSALLTTCTLRFDTAEPAAGGKRLVRASIVPTQPLPQWQNFGSFENCPLGMIP